MAVPAVPVAGGARLLSILSVAVAMRLMRLIPMTARGAAAVALYGLLAGWCVKTAADLHVFQAGGSARVLPIGEYVRRALPQEAVFVSVIEVLSSAVRTGVEHARSNGVYALHPAGGLVT